MENTGNKNKGGRKNRWGDKVRALRRKGYSYSQIVNELGCSLSTVRYNLDEARREHIKGNNHRNVYRSRARAAVREAVRQGRLPKVTTIMCNRCPDTANEYHHHSYERECWLDVEPLCHACHDAHHKAEDEALKAQEEDE